MAPAPSVPPLPPAPRADMFLNHVAALAQRLGVTDIAVAALEPGTNTVRFVATNDTDALRQLQNTVAEKWGMIHGGETAWGEG